MTQETRIEVNLDVPNDWSVEQIQNFVRMALNARVNSMQLNRGKIGLPAYALKVQGVIVLKSAYALKVQNVVVLKSDI